MKRIQQRKAAQAGAQAVEFALALPFLILIVFAVLDFGLIVYNKAIITNAAREAARQGTMLTGLAWDTGAVKQVACNYAGAAVVSVTSGSRSSDCSGSADPVITVTPGTTPAFGDPVTVSISYAVKGFTLGSWWNLGNESNSVGSALTLTASTSMRHE